MAEKIRKLASLAIAFTVICLVAEGLLRFGVIAPAPVMANPGSTTVVPLLKHANDTTGDNLTGITGDDAGVNDWSIATVSTTDNVYTVDQPDVMHLDTFDVSSIPDGSTITAAVLHLQWGAEEGYAGNGYVRYDNGDQ